jgi:hypothetical protein
MKEEEEEEEEEPTCDKVTKLYCNLYNIHLNIFYFSMYWNNRGMDVYLLSGRGLCN